MEQKNKIPLRQFYRNIDEYILNQSHEQAVLYSKFLLKKYPKNVMLYQLLGKAYLDKKQYDLAFLLFNKILDIDPDDFVSHIGTSLISENFGNIESAYTSMLRAYEIQPSNESLQNEVLRLIRLKDGFAPEKLRLTRGALIKMYARSKLTDQAIAEAKLGLHESPERIDFMIHLADMLAISQKPEDALEICFKVIKTQPYCKPILNILFRILSENQDLDQADIYKSRLSELDPYFGFMKPDTKSVNDIPDVAIMVDAGVVPSDEIENLEAFMERVWNDENIFDHADQPEDEPDWEKIVDDAVANDGIGAPINDDVLEVVNELKTDEKFDEDTNVIPLSRREKFRNKLSGDEMSIQRNGPSAEEIPDWILSYDAINRKSEQKFDHHQKTENDDEWISPHVNDFEEDGMTDHSAPINPDVEDEGLRITKTDWKQIEESEVINNTDAVIPALDDTQKIKIVKQDPEEIEGQLEEALLVNDNEFASKCIESLLAKEHNLSQVAEKIENYLQKFPEKIELWLFLVRIYRKLELNDKALAALGKAQTNISI